MRASIRRKRANKPCARCGINPRRVSKTGRVMSYCRECERQYKRPYVPDVSVPHDLQWFDEVYAVLIKHPDFPDGRYIRYAVKTLLRSGALEFEMDTQTALLVMYQHYPLPGEALNPFRKLSEPEQSA